MSTWMQFEREAPELARRARELFDAHKHKLMGTIRADGSPRLSGIEFAILDGEVWFGSMGGALKARDLLRDPRLSLHSGSADPPAWTGDAKLSGRAGEITDEAEKDRRLRQISGGGDYPPGPSHLFKVALDEVSVVEHGDPADHLLIRVWKPRRGVVAHKRY